MRCESRPPALRRLAFAIVLLVAGAAFSRSNQRLEAAQPELWLTVDKYAYLMSEKPGGEVRKVEVGENAYYTATSPDGKLVAVASFGLLDQNIPVLGPLAGKDLPAGKKVIPQPEAKRFLVVSNTKLSLYDYDFNLMHEIEGKFDPKDIHIDNLHAVGSVSVASESRK